MKINDFKRAEDIRSRIDDIEDTILELNKIVDKKVDVRILHCNYNTLIARFNKEIICKMALAEIERMKIEAEKLRREFDAI